MAEPRWIQHTELRDYANHPLGNIDNGNRPFADFYDTEGPSGQHNDDGSIKGADFQTAEEDVIAGNSTDDRDVALTNTGLDVIFAIVLAAGTEYPVIRTVDMVGDVSKELGTAALQSNEIQSVATVGEIQLGDDAAVNATGTNYDYLTFGTGQ